jgi:hypothetical protein
MTAAKEPKTRGGLFGDGVELMIDALAAPS